MSVRFPNLQGLFDRLQFDKTGLLMQAVKPAVAPEITTHKVVGTVSAERLFQTTGVILQVVYQDKLRWMYHENGQYKREDGSVVLSGELDPAVRYRIAGRQSVVAKGNAAVVFGSKGSGRIAVSTYAGTLPLISGTSHGPCFVREGKLYRVGQHGLQYPEPIGDVLDNQTLFWTGEKLGFGFYRAGQLSRYFVFNPQANGINDGVRISTIPGQLFDSVCAISHNRIWFFISTREGGSEVNRAFCVDSKGAVLGQAEAPNGSDSWLGSIRGACAVNDFLLAPTDDGVVQVRSTDDGRLVVTKEFTDTSRFVDAGSQLFPSGNGLAVASGRQIWQLTIN
jgi:hypothetical protein